MDIIDDSEDSRTLFCGNLPSKCTEDLLYELFLQAGPLERVRIPFDREGRPVSYGFITFRHQCSVPYAMNIFDGITIFKTRLNLRTRSTNNANAPAPPLVVMCNNTMNTIMQQSGCGAGGASPPITMNLYQQQQQQSPNNRTPSGRNDYYRNESLQGRWNPYNNKREMRPSDNRKHSSNSNNYKRHKR